jgi:hypothetical protein
VIAGADPDPPAILREVAERFVTCEAATLTRDGRPVTWPLTPYRGERGATVDVSTGLTYPAKAERARRDARTALLFSDPTGSGMEPAPVVLVRGLATVRDRDLQANSDRYVRLSMAKLPRAWRWTPGPLIRAQRWYFARIWISVTPLEMLWWPGGDVDQAPERWLAPGGTAAPASDPAPLGRGPSPWRDRIAAWRDRAEEALAYCPRPVLTVVGGHGFPVPFRVAAASVVDDAVRLEMPAGMPVEPTGPACLTFHAHGEPFVGQRNAAFRGSAVRVGGGEVRFRVERALGDFSIPGGRLRRSAAFLAAGRRLAPRLRREATRRGQPVPRVNLAPPPGRAG